MVTTTQVSIRYIGDGATVEFSYPYSVLDVGHLTITEDGTPTSAWTATLDSPGPGATVTMSSAPASGVALVITRVTPWTQLVDFTPGARLNAETLESTVDKLTLILQEMAALCGAADNPLPAPSSLAATATGEGDSVQLDWTNNATDATSVEIQFNSIAGGSFGNWVTYSTDDEGHWTPDTPSVKITDSDWFSVGELWSFRIRAWRTGLAPGEPSVASPWSNTSSVTVT